MKRRTLGALLILLGGVGLALVVALWSLAGTGGTSMEWFWLLVVPALLLMSGLGMRRTPAPSTTPDAPEADIDEDDRTPVTVTGVPEGPVSACMRCGSMRIQPAPMGADALFAEYRCARCHFRGQPLQFDTGDAYAAFVRGLHRGGDN